MKTDYFKRLETESENQTLRKLESSYVNAGSFAYAVTNGFLKETKPFFEAMQAHEYVTEDVSEVKNLLNVVKGDSFNETTYAPTSMAEHVDEIISGVEETGLSRSLIDKYLFGIGKCALNNKDYVLAEKAFSVAKSTEHSTINERLKSHFEFEDTYPSVTTPLYEISSNN